MKCTFIPHFLNADSTMKWKHFVIGEKYLQKYRKCAFFFTFQQSTYSYHLHNHSFIKGSEKNCVVCFDSFLKKTKNCSCSFQDILYLFLLPFLADFTVWTSLECEKDKNETRFWDTFVSSKSFIPCIHLIYKSSTLYMWNIPNFLIIKIKNRFIDYSRTL